MKQQSIMLNANCQLIQFTHITDLLSNLKGFLDSMIIKVFVVMQNALCSCVPKHSSTVPCYTIFTCVTIITLLSTLKDLC